MNNEPLLDKRLPEMIAAARKALPGAFLQVSTNGIKLTPELALLLWERGLDELFVNEYSEERILSERIAKVIRETPDKYRGKIHVALRPIHAVLLNRAGSSPNSEGDLKRSLPAFCNLPFTQLNIVHDGQVSLCCQDLFVKSQMGNVMDEGVLGVWFGEKFQKSRRDLLNMDRTQNPLCAVCDYPGFKTVSGPYRFLNRLVNLIR